MGFFKVYSLVFVVTCAFGAENVNVSDYIIVKQLRQNMGLYFDYVNEVKFVADSWNFVIEIEHKTLFDKIQFVYTEGSKLISKCQNFTDCDERNTIIHDTTNHILHKCTELLEYHKDIENKIKLVSNKITGESDLTISTIAPDFTHRSKRKRSILKRHKRGLIDIVGKVDKYLFGVMDSEDAEELHKLAQTSNSLNEQVKSLTSDLIDMSETVSERLTCIEQELHLTSKCAYLSKMYQALRDELGEIEKVYNRLSMAVDFAEENQLNSYVISPQYLLEAMSEVNKNLPNNLNWPIPLKIEHMYNLIGKLIVTHAFVTDTRSIVFIVEVPLVKTTEFNLFRTIAVPMCNQFDSCVLIMPSSKYIGLTSNKHQYVRMNDIDSCKPIEKVLICLKSHIVYQTANSDMCDIQIFNNQNMTENFDKICDVRVGKFNRETIERISDHNRYMYIMKENKTVNVECHTKTDSILMEFKLMAGVGIIEGTGKYRCEMSTDESTLPFQELKSTLLSVLRHNPKTEFQLNTFIADAARIHLNDTINRFNVDHKSLQQITMRLRDLRASMDNNTIFKGRDLTDDDDVLGSWWSSLDFGLWKDLKIFLYIIIMIALCLAAYKIYSTCFASKTTTKTIIRNNYDREMVYLKPQPVPTSDQRRYSDKYKDTKF
ncbi:F protein [Alphabaculovirus altermyunipunctae]|uniref:F protein n=1 Tax=Mythimna unipuncta nucleopolyhedrovirus TaxID=447897 RepID=A0A346TPT5_9ABAC|nr:F protein [Mythimna unipuncta nucleopolyhedrovirus]AXU41595.1 F protein [Mythimna unipuncta nucleopolyhedrovirus]